MAKEKKKRFIMDTRAFVTIWRDHLAQQDSNQWKKFCLACFERFSNADEHKNHVYLEEKDANWKDWDDEKRFSFMSEKAYSKAVVIRRTLRDPKKISKTMKVELPNGYLGRNGSQGKGKVSPEEIADIFRAV